MEGGAHWAQIMHAAALWLLPVGYKSQHVAAAALGPAAGEAAAALALTLAARGVLPGDWGPLWQPLAPALLSGVLCTYCWTVGAHVLLPPHMWAVFGRWASECMCADLDFDSVLVFWHGSFLASVTHMVWVCKSAGACAPGSRILNIVFTERLRFARPGDPDPNAALLQALQDSKARHSWRWDDVASPAALHLTPVQTARHSTVPCKDSHTSHLRLPAAALLPTCA